MKYTRNTAIYTKKIKEKWYILEGDKKTMRELNEVASFVWELVAKAQSLDVLVSKVCKEYQVDEGVAKSDIETFLTEYKTAGFIITMS